MVSRELSGMQGESVGSLGGGSLGRWAAQIDDACVQMEAQQHFITSQLRSDEPTANRIMFHTETPHGAGGRCQVFWKVMSSYLSLLLKLTCRLIGQRELEHPSV